MASNPKPVVHKVDPKSNTFTDITHEFGDISALSAGDLARKMAEFAAKKGIDPKLIINEAVG